ncbi:hypothetical protein [Legionella erythra]|uniref:Uncharacterized protein n=1 Tax=Legionella erythra TaxID=448 RepID=A0A0W0TVJ0_LEGER|nr:hypothetical protein [Legionella erythra]KTC99386.1 hypothetical protein Lery_0287 [Legionella erythra]
MNTKGFILVTALLFLSLMMLLVLSQQQLVWLYQQSLNRLIHKHQSLHAMEKQLRFILDKGLLRKGRACLLHSDDVNQVINRLLQGQGCLYVAKESSYRYFVEELGVFSCMQHVAENRLYSTHHWRLTMASADREILQIRFAQLVAEQPCKLQSPVFIKPGLLSWRFLLA